MDMQIEAGSVYSLESLLQTQNQNHLHRSMFPSLIHEALSSQQRVSLPATPFSSNPFECSKSFVDTSEYSSYGGCLPFDTRFVIPQGGDGNTFPNEWPMNVNSSHLSSSFNNESSLSLAANPQVSFTKTLLGSAAFLHAAQEILAEIASFALGHNNCFSSEESSHRHVVNNSIAGFSDQNRAFMEAEAKKSHLLALLQLVDEQYNQCLDDIHTVISAFHVVTDLDPNLHSRFALPRISIMYKNHQIWKPQRGLPEQSISVLKAWMFQNFLHP